MYPRFTIISPGDFEVEQWLLPSLILLFSFSHLTAAVDSTDRSPRPTSAPAIAQSQVTEGSVPGASVKKTVASKAQKETVEVEVKTEEEPPEQAEPEPAEVWKVCQVQVSS